MAEIAEMPHRTKGLKKLDSATANATGFQEGVYAISERENPRGESCTREDCGQTAQLFEQNIIGVIDEDGHHLHLNDLEPETREILMRTNRQIKLCLMHLFESVAEGNLFDQIQEKK